MKTLQTILALALVSISTCTIAQTRPPTPPEPPVPNRTTTEVTSSNVSVITQSGDYGKGGNTSFSVSNSDDEYRLKSRYPENRFPAVKKYLMQELGTKGMQSSGNAMAWSLEGNEDTVYKVALDDTKLKIELDKTLASPILISKFEDMGDVLHILISGGDERQKIVRLERDAARAQRDAERMQREAARLQESFKRDAARLEREAKKLEREAERLSLVSKRGGGIDGYVREILSHPSTKYNMQDKDYTKWNWPAFQNALITKLVVNKFATLNEDLVFTSEDGHMYANGMKLPPSLVKSIEKDLSFYNFDPTKGMTFYKSNNHVVVLDDADDLEDILKWLSEKEIIADTTKDTTLEINGNSLVIDGTPQILSVVKDVNKYLNSKGLIPAPGKTIKLGKNFASMGYSFGKNTLGVWTSR